MNCKLFQHYHCAGIVMGVLSLYSEDVCKIKFDDGERSICFISPDLNDKFIDGDKVGIIFPQDKSHPMIFCWRDGKSFAPFELKCDVSIHYTYE